MSNCDNNWTSLADEVASFGKNTIHSLSINSESGLQILTSILYRRVVYGLVATLLLVQHKLLTESRFQRRGQLEALFSLGALWKQPDIMSDFINNDTHRLIKLYTNMRNTSKKFKEHHLDGISNSEIDEILVNLNKNKVGSYLSIKSLSQKAELYDLFLSDYAVLSESAHHLAKDLERHVTVNTDKKITGFVVEDEDTTAENILYPAIDTMLMATDAINSIFNISLNSDIKEISDKVVKLKNS